MIRGLTLVGVAVALAGGLLLTRGGHAAGLQDGGQQPAQSFNEELSVGYILVPVVVEGAQGPVAGLDRGDFDLRVDDQPVPLESFESGNAPFSLFLLQDLSGSMALLEKLAASKKLINCFLDRAQPGDLFALHTFAGNELDIAVESTSDVRRVREAMRGWRGYGTTALHDAIGLLPNLLVGSPSTRRAALLISDGLDNASELGAIEARDRIRASEVPVYVVGFDTGDPFELTREGEKRYRYADVMNLLAHLSGGRYHSVVDRSGLEEVCEAILEDLRHQYILGFSAGGNGPAGPHRIDVGVNRKNVEVSHRRSYNGRPPITSSQ